MAKFVSSSPCITYKLNSPEASAIYEKQKLSGKRMQDFVDEGLAEVTQVGYQHPINFYIVHKAMEEKGKPYVFPSWVRGDAKRFIIETMTGDETGTLRVFEGMSIEQVEQYLLYHASQYQVYITDICHRKDSEITKEWRKQRKAKEQEELMLRKADLDKREARLNAREEKINAGLNELRAQIDSIQADLSNKPRTRKVRIVIRDKKPTVAITNEGPTPYPQSEYIKPNGIVNNVAIAEKIHDYMIAHNAIMSPKDLEQWVLTYCPAVVSRWADVTKGVYNVLTNNLKGTGKVRSVGRGQYTAI